MGGWKGGVLGRGELGRGREAGGGGGRQGGGRRGGGGGDNATSWNETRPE
jgi:hypothetical protein